MMRTLVAILAGAALFVAIITIDDIVSRSRPCCAAVAVRP